MGLLTSNASTLLSWFPKDTAWGLWMPSFYSLMKSSYGIRIYFWNFYVVTSLEGVKSHWLLRESHSIHRPPPPLLYNYHAAVRRSRPEVTRKQWLLPQSKLWWVIMKQQLHTPTGLVGSRESHDLRERPGLKVEEVYLCWRSAAFFLFYGGHGGSGVVGRQEGRHRINAFMLLVTK